MRNVKFRDLHAAGSCIDKYGVGDQGYFLSKLQSLYFPHCIIPPCFLPSKSSITKQLTNKSITKITNAKHCARSFSTVPDLKEFASSGINTPKEKYQLKLMLQSQLLSIP